MEILLGQGDTGCLVYRTGIYIIYIACALCRTGRSEILLVLYAGQGDTACPVYRTGLDREILLTSCIQDREIFLVLYT